MKIENIKIGKPVIYWGVITEKGIKNFPFISVIISDHWKLESGDVVCKIKGKSGGMLITHLDEITPGSLMAAKCQGLKTISDDDIKKATSEYFEKKVFL